MNNKTILIPANHSDFIALSWEGSKQELESYVHNVLKPDFQNMLELDDEQRRTNDLMGKWRFKGVQVDGVTCLEYDKPHVIRCEDEWNFSLFEDPGNIHSIEMRLTQNNTITMSLTVELNTLLHSYEGKISKEDLQYYCESLIDKNHERNRVEHDGANLINIPESRRNYELYLAAVESNGAALGLVPSDEITLDLCKAALKSTPKVFEEMLINARDNKEVRSKIYNFKNHTDEFFNERNVNEGINKYPLITAEIIWYLNKNRGMLNEAEVNCEEDGGICPSRR